MAPFWKLVAKFGEVELPGPPQTTEICPCAYCWCGKFKSEISPVSIFRSFISAEAKALLRELLDGHGPDDRGDYVSLTSEILTETDDRPLGEMETQDEDVSAAVSTSEEGNKTADDRINGQQHETTKQSKEQQTIGSDVDQSLASTSSFVGRRSSTSEASDGLRNLENSAQSKEIEEASGLDSVDVSDSFQSRSSFRETSPQQSSSELENARSISSTTLKSNSEPSISSQDPETQSKCVNMRDNRTTTSLEGGQEFPEAAVANVLRSPVPPEAHQTQAPTASSLTSRLQARDVLPLPMETPSPTTTTKDLISSNRRASLVAPVNDIDFRRRISWLLTNFIMQRVCEKAAKFQCDQCERAFVRNSSLVAHLDSHGNSPGNTSQLSPLNARSLQNISQTSRKSATYVSMLENPDLSQVVGHKRDSLASFSGFDLHRRLTLLQSTFMDLNASAAESGNVSLPEVHGKSGTLDTSGVSSAILEESSIFNTPTTRSSLNLTTSISSTPMNIMHVSHLRDSISSPSKFDLGRRFSFLQSSLLIKKAAPKFGCGHCERCFFRRGNLVIHMRKHQKILPFRCTLRKRQRRFISAAALAAHARNAHFEETTLDYLSTDLCSKTVEVSQRQPSQLAKRRTRRSTDIDDSPLLSPAANFSSGSIEVIENGVAVVEVEKPPIYMTETSGTNEQHDLSGKDAQAARAASSSQPELPRQETSKQPAKHLLDSDGCVETTDISVGVNFMPALEPSTGLTLPKEIAPRFSLVPVIQDDGDDFAQAEVGEGFPTTFCVDCNGPLSEKRLERGHPESPSGSSRQNAGRLMYCEACSSCQIDLPDPVVQVPEDSVPLLDDHYNSQDSEKHVHQNDFQPDVCPPGPSAQLKRRRSLRISQKMNSNPVHEEASESSDDGDDNDTEQDSAWTDSESESEESEQDSDGGGSDDGSSAAAASSHELSVINESKENLPDGDETPEIKSRQPEGRQRNPEKLTRGGKSRKHKNVCRECGEQCESRAALNLHLRKHDSVQTFKCGLCATRFETRKKYLIHIKSHKDQTGRYKCNQCEYSTKLTGHIIRHLGVHSGEKLHMCEDCGKAFSDLSYFKTHRRIHSGERPFKCDQCTESFTQSGHLTAHKRIHSGEKPYECDQCTKSFTQSGDLTVHKRVHSGERPYKCDQCTVSFTDSSSLIRHKRIHSGERPYKCDQCSKSFTQSGTLTKHKRLHSGERPYKCDQCTQSFTTSSNLTAHKRVHSGERPHQCNKCVKRFTCKSHLRRHQATQHTKKKVKQ